MLESAANDYSKYMEIDLETKLQPLNQTIDEMLLRLEEFETMVALAQQERCNAIGLTGSLLESMDSQKELKSLCTRIDKLEGLIEYIKTQITSLENKMSVAEEHFGLVDNTNKLKNFFLPLFKKSTETKTSPTLETSEPFVIEKYFIGDQNLQE